jgi:hypothetical protein
LAIALLTTERLRPTRRFSENGVSRMSKLPPVPPENRSNKGPGADPKVASDETTPPARENLREQGRQGNIHQNTHNQGYQQDR